MNGKKIIHFLFLGITSYSLQAMMQPYTVNSSMTVHLTSPAFFSEKKPKALQPLSSRCRCKKKLVPEKPTQCIIDDSFVGEALSVANSDVNALLTIRFFARVANSPFKEKIAATQVLLDIKDAKPEDSEDLLLYYFVNRFLPEEYFMGNKNLDALVRETIKLKKATCLFEKLLLDNLFVDLKSGFEVKKTMLALYEKMQLDCASKEEEKKT